MTMIEIIYPIYYLWKQVPIIRHSAKDKDYLLVYIHGAGHCGSTLLNLLLNAHPEIIGLSEISNLHKAFVDGSVASDSRENMNSEFWKDVLDSYQRRTGKSLLDDENRFTIPSWDDYLNENESNLRKMHIINNAFYDAIAEHTNARVICDSSKFLVRVHALISSGLPVKVIHMDRNGLGIVNSYLKKGATMKNAIKRWGSSVSGLVLLSHWLPKQTLYCCKYENLAKNPEKQLKKICGFLDLEFSEKMIADFMSTKNYGVAGNRMRLSNNTQIVIDDKWKKEMDLGTKTRFFIKGGWIYYPATLLSKVIRLFK